MYSACIFCHAALGANEVVEAFPVGRRLAFDGERGRLWVVCPRCQRWNLSPLEERWEAVEECERLFRDSRLRASTENVGLARVAEGTELVRIGRPQRPEMAAWRYGGRLASRARRARMMALPLTLLGGAAVVGLGFFAPPLLLGGPTLLATSHLSRQQAHGRMLGRVRQAVGSLRTPGGEPVTLEGEALLAARLLPEGPEGWTLLLRTGTADDLQKLRVTGTRAVSLHGPPAVHAAAVLLASANRYDGSRREVRGAVRELETAGDAASYFAVAERHARRRGWGHADLWAMPTEIRLALEMAAHDDAERRALEGELQELEARWREAEEIAAIADRLALPPSVERWMEERKREGEGG